VKLVPFHRLETKYFDLVSSARLASSHRDHSGLNIAASFHPDVLGDDAAGYLRTANVVSPTASGMAFIEANQPLDVSNITPQISCPSTSMKSQVTWEGLPSPNAR
jgi:hypothetical protein